MDVAVATGSEYLGKEPPAVGVCQGPGECGPHKAVACEWRDGEECGDRQVKGQKRVESGIQHGHKAPDDGEEPQKAAEPRSGRQALELVPGRRGAWRDKLRGEIVHERLRP